MGLVPGGAQVGQVIVCCELSFLSLSLCLLQMCTRSDRSGAWDNIVSKKKSLPCLSWKE